MSTLASSGKLQGGKSMVVTRAYKSELDPNTRAHELGRDESSLAITFGYLLEMNMMGQVAQGRAQTAPGKSMIVMRAYKTELDPTQAQQGVMVRDAGTARFAYNWGYHRIEDFRQFHQLPIP
jgi:hypothetical protein